MSHPSPALDGPYRVDFRCDDHDPLQRELNRLYDYQDDIPTKVLHRSRLNLFYLLAQELIENGTLQRFGTAVDVGCNAGYYSKLISDFGLRDVLGLDVVDEMIARARSTFERDGLDRRIRFRLAGVESLPDEPTFDFLLCTEVIEHTEQPLETIRKLSGCLAPGGIGVISLPNRLSIPFLAAQLIRRLKSKPRDAVFEEHLRYPFYRSMRLFRERGLEIVRTTATNLILDDHVLDAIYGTRYFERINRWNFELSRRAPLKFCSQFFFMVVRKPLP